MPAEPGSVSVQPLVHVENLDAAIDFYRALGAELVGENPDGDFALIEFGGTQVALLAHPPNPADESGPVELTLVTEALDDVLRQAGVAVDGPISDTVFGRQAKLRTPDGRTLKVNEFRG